MKNFVVYLLLHAGKPEVKIGIARCPITRAKELPQPIDLERSFQIKVLGHYSPYKIEQTLHMLCAQYALDRCFLQYGVGHSEWFSADCLQEIRATVAKMRKVWGISELQPIPIAIKPALPEPDCDKDDEGWNQTRESLIAQLEGVLRKSNGDAIAEYYRLFFASPNADDLIDAEDLRAQIVEDILCEWHPCGITQIRAYPEHLRTPALCYLLRRWADVEKKSISEPQQRRKIDFQIEAWESYLIEIRKPNLNEIDTIEQLIGWLRSRNIDIGHVSQNV